MSTALELLTIHERPSPNHRSRGGEKIRLIVLHSDASPSMAATIDWLEKSAADLRALWEKTDPDERPAKPWGPVSYHYSVGRTGWTCRHVADSKSAYHAGVSEWRGERGHRNGVNDFSIGVNLSNRQSRREPYEEHAGEPYPEAQLDATARLVASLCIDHRIPASAICTHAQCARPEGRKHDPYPGGPFDLMAFLGLVNDWAGRIHCDLLSGGGAA
ncbi:MAG TPA: N-acetylmuramoyl-L-alanine amidase [Gemmatimonadaceae bacterium]|nr:N-acetylmuramoyl-L-alanine amidase [Gemmatimonadaceae bacterium]